MSRSGVASLGICLFETPALLIVRVSSGELILVCSPARFAILSTWSFYPPYIILILQARVRRSQNQAVDAGVPEHDVGDNIALVYRLVLVCVKAQVQDR